MYYLEWYDTKKNVGLGKIGVENDNLEEITEKAIEIYKGQCKADKEHIEIVINDTELKTENIEYIINEYKKLGE